MHFCISPVVSRCPGLLRIAVGAGCVTPAAAAARPGSRLRGTTVAAEMNRGTRNLVAIAPKPSGAAVSLDPRDYLYPQPAEQTFVWGIPQADVLSQHGMMHMGAYMMSHQNVYSNFPIPSSPWPTASYQRLPSQGGSWHPCAGLYIARIAYSLMEDRYSTVSGDFQTPVLRGVFRSIRCRFASCLPRSRGLVAAEPGRS